ncbi:MAG: DUF4118 domain-containing protein [Lachnospiraceae bacterium]|nr:DUF4118 domain-containing protein [Lachnospiraceae bacterium]
MFRHTNEKYSLPKKHPVSVNILITLGILLATTAISALFLLLDSHSSAAVYLLYVLALFFISRYTNGYVYGIISSLVSVICVNYIFTYPFFKLNFTLSGYPLTFALMLTITLITSAMTSHLCKQAKIIKERETLLREAELEKMRANLLRAISHDLRTPLTGIIGNSSSYLENYDKLSAEDKTELVRSIHNDSNWLLNMVENLLTVTRIQGDNLQVHTSLEPVEEVVSEALMRLGKRFPKAEIHARVPEEMLFVPMDAVLIEQVIINLIENAIVHSGSTRPIDLIVSKQPKQVLFIVRDYGNGIAPEKLDNLFDGGSYISREASDTHKGMGIGLSICKTIITAHHGEIYGENHESGAQFCFYLPKGDNKNES